MGISTRWTSSAIGCATFVGHTVKTSSATLSASDASPIDPAKAATKMRNGKSAMSADRATWLAMAQPSSALKWPPASNKTTQAWRIIFWSPIFMPPLPAPLPLLPAKIRDSREESWPAVAGPIGSTRRTPDHHPAVGRKRLPGDIGRIVGSQKDDRAGNFAGLRHTTERNETLHPPQLLGVREARVHRSHCRAWADAVDPDAVASVTERQCARHAGDAGLGHDVGDRVFIDGRRGLDRGRGDDHPRSAGIEKMLDGGLGTEKRTTQVNRHDFVVIRDQRLVRLVDDLDAGIGDKDIEAVESLDDSGKQRIDRVLVRDISQREHVAAFRMDAGKFIYEGLGRLRVAEEIDRNAGAFLGKADSGSPPDAGGRPGNQHP